MKRLLLSASLLSGVLFSNNTNAQIPDYGVWPSGVTFTDINGTTYDIDAILNSGKSVVIDAFNDWCAQCWTYHQGHALENLYTSYGPSGTNELMVFGIETHPGSPEANISDATTGLGDWTVGISYPQANDDNLAGIINLANFPTIILVCPDRTVTEVGQISTAQHYAVATACASVPTNSNDPRILSNQSDEVFCTGETANISVVLQNYGSANLTAATIEVFDGATSVASQNWVGNLAQYDYELVNLGNVSPTGLTTYSIRITSTNDDASNDEVSATIAPAPVLDVGLSNMSLTLDMNVDDYANEIGVVFDEGALPSTDYFAIHNAALSNPSSVLGFIQAGTLTNGTNTITREWNVNNSGCHFMVFVDTYGDGYDFDTPSASISINGLDGSSISVSPTFASGKHQIFDVQLTCENNIPIQTQTACDVYSWEGQNYTQSGVYNNVLTNQYGCDSVLNLDLTILNSTTSILNDFACDSYNLNGQIYNISGNYTQVLTNSVGCDSTIYLDLIINNSSSNLITEITCGSYTLNGQTYTSSGTYTQTLTNSQGCDSTITLNLTVNPNSFDPSFTVNQTLFTSPPFVCQFTNTTPSMGNYNFTWYWGDGTSLVSNNPSVFHEYLYNGLYTVTLIAEDMNTGCSDTVIYSDYIYTAGGVSCTHSSIINQTGTLNVCSGDTLLLNCNSSGTFTYQWNRNGVTIPNSDNDTLYITEGGTYTVTIIEGGCPVTSSPINVTEDNITQPVISSSGTIISCSGGSVTLDAGGGYSSYSWSSGGNQQQESVSQSGSYTVTVTSSNGCSSTSTPFVVNASFLPIQDICIVGVDSLTNYNRIIWEKPLIAGIDSFYVYRETSVSDVYGFIGSLAYEDTAIFIDYGSNPGVQPFRYKLAMLDTCGVETSLGDFHKTIHLTINQGAGNTYNLIWSSYEGLSFGSYNIYRGTSPTNMTLLTTVQSNINSYSDLNPPVGSVYYQIEIVGPNCNPLKANNYNSSRSNVADNGMSGIQEIENNNLNLFPNPTTNSFTITSEKVINSNFRIMDGQGRAVFTGTMNGQEHTMDISKLSKGVYLVVFEQQDLPVLSVVKE